MRLTADLNLHSIAQAEIQNGVRKQYPIREQSYTITGLE
jgi:hypothetical protein